MIDQLIALGGWIVSVITTIVIFMVARHYFITSKVVFC